MLLFTPCLLSAGHRQGQEGRGEDAELDSGKQSREAGGAGGWETISGPSWVEGPFAFGKNILVWGESQKKQALYNVYVSCLV